MSFRSDFVYSFECRIPKVATYLQTQLIFVLLKFIPWNSILFAVGLKQGLILSRAYAIFRGSKAVEKFLFWGVEAIFKHCKPIRGVTPNRCRFNMELLYNLTCRFKICISVNNCRTNTFRENSSAPAWVLYWKKKSFLIFIKVFLGLKKSQ